MLCASLTKLATACCVLPADLKRTFPMCGQILEAMKKRDASMAGFNAGEPVSFKQLIQGLLMASGADCACMLARIVCGSESAFIERMNAFAASLKLDRTLYVSCTGFDTGSVSSARDTALLFDAALDNPLLRKTLSAPFAFLPPAKGRPFGRRLRHTLSLKGRMPKQGRIRIEAGKTGFTDEAGQCLVSLCTLQGREFILATMGAKGDYSTPRYHVEDALMLYQRLDRHLAASRKAKKSSVSEFFFPQI